MATLFAPLFDLQPPIAMPTDCTTSRRPEERARLRFNSARRVSLQNDNASTRQNVELRWPTTPPSQIKTQTCGFFRAGCALSRPRRRANNPSAAPDVAQTQIGPAQAPLFAAPERGRLIAQGLRFHIPSKARVLMRKARRRDVHWSTWAPVERGASGPATYSARRSATAASPARALCAEAHKLRPNAAGERYSAATTWPQT